MATVASAEFASGAEQPRRVENWAKIAGRWTASDSNSVMRYLGPDDPQGGAPMGLARGSVRFRDGTVSTRITLARNHKTSAGLAFGFESLNAPYLIATLGGFDKAYAVGEYRPGQGWWALESAGSLANLDAGIEYDISVAVQGQTMRMTVDSVDVISVVLPRPIEGTGLGLYAWGDAEVSFAETSVIGIAPRIFVIMPFSEPFDTLYHDVIYPVADRAGFDVVRVDEIHGPGIILDDIQRQIEQSHAVVAEISTHNPNVFYELGYAHALKKPAVILVRRQDGSQMPFDVRGYRAIFYDDSIGGKKNVERNLEQHLAAILRDS